jgi:ligand-binding sensor domain-containing protein
MCSDPNGNIWAATSGGMFMYKPSDGTFVQYTTSEGLNAIDLTAIASDNQGRIWIGSSNGLIQMYDPAHNAWTYINDIESLTAAQKGINGLQFSGDSLYILSAIGVSVYLVSEMQFGDTYGSYGTYPNQISGSVTSLQFYHGSLWIGTQGGVASTPMTNPNPAAPESWQVYTTTQGLPANTVTAVTSAQDTLYAATSAGLARYSNGSWDTVAGTAGQNIFDVASSPYAIPLAGSGNRYPLFVTANALWANGSGGAHIIASGFDTTFSTVRIVQITLSNSVHEILTAIGSTREGVLLQHGTTWKSVFPSGPFSNHFIGLAVDGHGVVWSGTGRDSADGFMSFDGSSWKSYTTAQYPQLVTNDYIKVSIGPNDSKWVGNYGVGVALLNSQGNLREVYTIANGLLPCLTPPQNQAYVVVEGIATDAAGNVWISNRTPPGDTALTIFHSDSSFSYVTGLVTRLNPPLIFTDILIDEYGTKWFANFNRFEPVPPQALYFYNESMSIPGTSGGWGSLTTASGLASNEVWSLALGHEGELWVGSEQGITIIFDPSNPQAEIALYHPLSDQIIQGILTDPLDQKWVATRQGVFVMSSDGTTIINQYTAENTQGKLVSDDVTSLAIDPNTGTIYFGSEYGLSSLTTASVTPNATTNALIISPNPYLLPSTVQLKIDGLMAGSSIKILTVSGLLVKNIQTPGGRVGYWDGTDQSGNLVASGIYIITAASGDGSTFTNGKVAVLRK